MKHKAHTTAVLVLLVAFCLRLYNLGTQPLSGDEAFTVTQWGTASIKTLLTDIAREDPQPPVALLSYYTWIQLAGSSEFAGRFFSTLFSLITVAASYTFTRKITRNPVPLLVMLLCATNPFQIWYSQDIRPYAEWIAFSLLTLTAFLFALPSKRILPWLIYIILASISLQTFYLELFSFASCAAYALYYFLRNRHFRLRWLASQIIIVSTLIPWLIYSKPQDNPYQPTASFPAIPPTISELIFGSTLPTILANPLSANTQLTLLQVVLLALILTAIVVVIRTNTSQHRYLILFAAILPIFFLTILSLITQKAFFRSRYIAVTSIPLLIMLAILSTSLYRTYRRRILATLLAALTLALNIGSLTQYHFNPQYAKAPPWRDITTILHDTASPQDIVILNYPDPAFPYYYTGPAATTILPSHENPPPEVTTKQLAQIPQNYRRIWFLRVDTPFWDNQQVVSTWLEANTAYLTDTWIGNMRLYQYASWETTPEFSPNQLNANLALAILHGFTITPSPPYLTQPDTITIELFWQPLQKTPTDLRIFVHLISTNPDGAITLAAQDDHPPQQGRHSTTTWPTDGTILRDIYRINLQPDTPDGTYLLTVGFYDPTTSTSVRYPIPSSLNQPESNAMLITPIQITHK